MEPVEAGGEFENFDGSGNFTITATESDRGHIVGFEIIKPSQATEFWFLNRISDGAKDSVDVG